MDADWEQLCADLRDGGKDYEGNVEELFQAELYLISPLTEPERFLNKEYFLTAQQRDIERQILKKIRAERTGAYWFTGLPGTGKTLLLYDIAMKLSGKQRVCISTAGRARRTGSGFMRDSGGWSICQIPKLGRSAVWKSVPRFWWMRHIFLSLGRGSCWLGSVPGGR
mgnify:FL=1